MRPRSRLTNHQSRKFHDRQKTRLVFVAALIVISAGTWIFSLSRLSWLSVFTVDTVVVKGADPDIAPVLQARALSMLSGSYLGIFSRANSFMYPRAAMTAAVLAASPRVSSVKVSPSSLHALDIDVTEKAPASIVCAGLPDFSRDDADGCYFTDQAGLILGPAPSFTGHVYNRYYMPALADNATGTAELSGQLATSTPEFNALQDFYNGAAGAGIGVAAILSKDGGEYELYADNPARAGLGASATATTSDPDLAVIYFNDAGSLPVELADLVSFWKNRVSAAAAAHTNVGFDYIDLRYGSNIYYRAEGQ